MEEERKLERRVLNLGIDWAEFDRLADETSEQLIGGCNHDHTQTGQILASMGLDEDAIEACSTYLSLQGGYCDCEVVFNVQMTDPKPLVDFSCEDCGSDYDEYYMVQSDIWKAHGVNTGNGMLCIGCLEERMGRQLCRQDFYPSMKIDADANRSLRLQDRLSTGMPSLKKSA
jgi:hypothetical protein